MLEESQQRFQVEAEARKNLETDWQNRLQQSEVRLQQQQQEKDMEMKHIMNRYVMSGRALSKMVSNGHSVAVGRNDQQHCHNSIG